MDKNTYSTHLKKFINLKIDMKFSKRSHFAKKLVASMSYNYAYRLKEENFQFCPNLYIWQQIASALDMSASQLLKEFEQYISSHSSDK